MAEERKVKQCPYCNEEILATAKKCKQCHSLIEEEPLKEAQATKKAEPRQASKMSPPIPPKMPPPPSRMFINQPEIVKAKSIPSVPKTPPSISRKAPPPKRSVKQPEIGKTKIFAPKSNLLALFNNSYAIITVLILLLAGIGISAVFNLTKKHDESILLPADISSEYLADEQQSSTIGEVITELYYVIVQDGEYLDVLNNAGTSNNSENNIAHRLSRGTRVEIFDKHNNSIVIDGTTWWEIWIPERQLVGWIDSEYVSTNPSLVRD